MAWEEAIEQIDIGGPALLRGGGEEPRPRRTDLPTEDYETVLGELRSRRESRSRRDVSLAARAFRRPPRTTPRSHAWLGRDDDFPETYVPVFDR